MIMNEPFILLGNCEQFSECLKHIKMIDAEN